MSRDFTHDADKAFTEIKSYKMWKVVKTLIDPITVNGEPCTVEVRTEDDFLVCLPLNESMAEYIVKVHNYVLETRNLFPFKVR